jgi:hypothetical protein
MKDRHLNQGDLALNLKLSINSVVLCLLQLDMLIAIIAMADTHRTLLCDKFNKHLQLVWMPKSALHMNFNE